MSVLVCLVRMLPDVWMALTLITAYVMSGIRETCVELTLMSAQGSVEQVRCVTLMTIKHNYTDLCSDVARVVRPVCR